MNTVVSQIRAEIAAIEPFDGLENTHRHDALAWIDSGANIFRIAAPDKPPKHLVAYFVLIDPDHNSILLGDHIKAQLWLPSGGHVEPNELPQQCIKRESLEELRQKAVLLHGYDKALFVTETVTVGLTPGHTDVSLWYLLRGGVHDRIEFEREAYHDMAWFGFDEILASHPAIFDTHMQRFTRKLMQHLSERH